MKVSVNKKYIIACNTLSKSHPNKKLADEVAEMLTYYSAKCGRDSDKRSESVSITTKIRNILKKYTRIGDYCDENDMPKWCFIEFVIPDREQKCLNGWYNKMLDEINQNNMMSL